MSSVTQLEDSGLFLSLSRICLPCHFQGRSMGGGPYIGNYIKVKMPGLGDFKPHNPLVVTQKTLPPTFCAKLRPLSFYVKEISLGCYVGTTFCSNITAQLCKKSPFRVIIFIASFLSCEFRSMFSICSSSNLAFFEK